MVVVILIILIIFIPLTLLWVKGIDFMNENHPDYKGDDLFGDSEEEAPEETDPIVRALQIDEEDSGWIEDNDDN